MTWQYYNTSVITLWYYRKPKPTDIHDAVKDEEPLYDTILDNPYYKRLMQGQQVETEGRYISRRKATGDKM